MSKKIKKKKQKGHCCLDLKKKRNIVFFSLSLWVGSRSRPFSFALLFRIIAGEIFGASVLFVFCLFICLSCVTRVSLAHRIRSVPATTTEEPGFLLFFFIFFIFVSFVRFVLFCFAFFVFVFGNAAAVAMATGLALEGRQRHLAAVSSRVTVALATGA